MEVPSVLLVLLVAALVGAAAVAASASRRTARSDAALRRLAERVGEGSDTRGSAPGAADAAAVERGIDALEDTVREADAIRAHLQRSLNAIPQGVIIADETGRTVSRNDVAAVFAEGRHGDALVQAAIEDLLAEALDGAPARRTVDLFEPPRRTLVISATPLDEDGRLTGALVVVDDISERRRLDAVRRDFVANISHELKTPVAAMSLLAETLAAEDDPDTARRLGERILTEAFRVNRTIEDLLALSRIESEEDLAREPVSVDLVVDEAVARIRPAAEHAGISLGVDLPGGDLTLVGDRRQLVSALSNLLDNAVKYSDPGTQVEVRARTVRSIDGDEALELSVTDHGIGIPARDLERVFERFYRVDQARSRETGGTGLGLAIVRHVVVNHHGTVEVESRTGEGSTFTLRLPMTDTPRTPEPPPGPRAGSAAAAASPTRRATTAKTGR